MLTSVDWTIFIDDFLCLRPGIVEPDGAISQIVVFSREVLGKDSPIRQTVGVRTIQRVTPVLMSVVAVA